MYFGQPDKVPEDFATTGYPVPTLTNPAKHVMNLVNKNFPGHGDVEALVERHNTKAKKDEAVFPRDDAVFLV
ncbi:hypothetical protein Pmar_PMAR028223 [Perkinsus marinus ATCC 50983]|uniref:Uncharacterized protein n=1 Tax=Perkinsus marinus (strain ATCC 50983 / TXsc) TaxID=423536 RepID=C5LBA7_PERM5|nr:hypothetical protein Pmar_PMAR028223 [Perkinsus marinus ATCC 50983]EER06035.1 hypothetical protein Pmar_PMAR028223 [Perkinsus marinus ATCC 50983]|eukprot:XP_002774219.1 hypothetical protein Pmar_PMAR028223 [Perkinsus marinus ATCC 50983]